MKILLTLAFKDLRLLIRDRIALFWSVAFPLIFALFFGSLFGGDGDGRGTMSVVVVDQAQSDASERFVTQLGESESLQVDTVDSLDAADALVRKGKRVAYLRILPEFADDAFALFGGGGDDPTLELGVDPTRSAEKGMLVGLITQRLFSGLGTQFSDPARMAEQLQDARESLAVATELSPERKESIESLYEALNDMSQTSDNGDAAAESPTASLGANMIKTAEIGRDQSGRPRSPFQVTIPSAIIWGLIGCATTFAASLVREKTAGTLLRLQVAPIGRGQLLAGKGLACFIAGMAIATLLMSIGVLLLGVEVGSYPKLVLTTACSAACFTGIMMLLSVSGKTEAAVAGGSWVIIMPLAMIGGGMVPLIAMPQWMLTASNISPFKWAILAMEGAIWRDLTMAELALPIGILLALAVGLYTLGVTLFRRQYG